MGRPPRSPFHERAPALVDGLLETVGVELARLDPEHVTGSAGDENVVAPSGRAGL